MRPPNRSLNAITFADPDDHVVGDAGEYLAAAQ
jgi:hypothetical protein